MQYDTLHVFVREFSPKQMKVPPSEPFLSAKARPSGRHILPFPEASVSPPKPLGPSWLFHVVCSQDMFHVHLLDLLFILGVPRMRTAMKMALRRNRKRRKVRSTTRSCRLERPPLRQLISLPNTKEINYPRQFNTSSGP